MFLVFVFITQFSNFWVMSYGNWKHILGVFKLSKLSFYGIFLIKHTLRDSQSEIQSQLLTNWTDFFFFFGETKLIFYVLEWVSSKFWLLSFKNGSHIFKFLKLKNRTELGAKWVGFGKFGYFKWWVTSDEWRKLSKKWWVMVF